MLERNEWSRIGAGWGHVDKNADGLVSLQEIQERFLSYQRAAALRPAPRDAMPKVDSEKVNGPTKSSVPRQRVTHPLERPTRSLPAWLRAKDTNRDGQIQMAEFETNWNGAKVAAFMREIPDLTPGLRRVYAG